MIILFSVLFSLVQVSHGEFASIVSTSPAITETLVELGARDRLVGISDYCHFTSDDALARVGSSIGLNYEKLVAIKPSVVFLQEISDQKTKNHLEKLSLAYLEFKFSTLEDIYQSIHQLGKEVSKEKKAQNIQFVFKYIYIQTSRFSIFGNLKLF